MKRREFPHSNLLPQPVFEGCGQGRIPGNKGVLMEAMDRDGDIPGKPSRSWRLAWSAPSTTRSSRRAGPTVSAVAQGQQLHLFRRRGDARLLRAEEVALHGHEEIDTMQMKHPNKIGCRPARRAPTRSSSASRKSSISAEDHADLGEGQNRRPSSTSRPRRRSSLKAILATRSTWVPMLQAATGLHARRIQGGGERAQDLRPADPRRSSAKARNLGFVRPGRQAAASKNGYIHDDGVVAQADGEGRRRSER